MSEGLTAIREQLLEALGTLPEPLRVKDIVPPAFTPPLVLMLPADPWVQPMAGQPLGTYEVGYQLLLIPAAGMAETTTPAIETYVDAVLDALDAPGHTWRVGEVSAPDDVTYAAGTYPTVRVAVAIPVRLTR